MTDATRARVCPERRTVMVYKTSNRGVVCQQGLNSAATAWPKETAVLCMHCVHGFSGPPVPIPREYNAVLRVYVVYGTFCSFSCAAGWIAERHFPDAQYQRVLLGRMARDIMGWGDSSSASPPIETAPAQERLAVFGGDLDIEAFRNRGGGGRGGGEHEVWQGFVREPPFVRVPAVLEEHLPRGTAVGLPGMLCKGVAAEVEAVEEDTPATASGVVPRGGLYADFLARAGGAGRGEPAEVHRVITKKRRRGGGGEGHIIAAEGSGEGAPPPRKKALKTADDIQEGATLPSPLPSPPLHTAGAAGEEGQTKKKKETQQQQQQRRQRQRRHCKEGGRRTTGKKRKGGAAAAAVVPSLPPPPLATEEATREEGGSSSVGGGGGTKTTKKKETAKRGTKKTKDAPPPSLLAVVSPSSSFPHQSADGVSAAAAVTGAEGGAASSLGVSSSAKSHSSLAEEGDVALQPPDPLPIKQQ